MQKLFLLLAGASLAAAQQYTIATLAGGAPPPTPSAALSTPIGQPQGVVLDSAGNVYFSASNAVFEMSAGGTVTRIAGNSRPGFSGDGGPALNAQLNSPQGLAFDSNGNLYIADSQNNRIRIVTAADGKINTFAGTGQVSPGGGPGNYGDGGPATSALLHLPCGVAVSGGNVYIADTADNTIREVNSSGIIQTIAGDSFPGFIGDTGPPTTAELSQPHDVKLDSSGNIYIADTQNSVIRQINTSGVINTFAGTGLMAGWAGDGAAATATTAMLTAPVALAIDAAGNVYVSENGDSRIRQINTKGILNTIAGSGLVGFAGDGKAATLAQMNFPKGIGLDSAGNLYIADTLNMRIRKISSSNIGTIAGNGVLSYSGDGGAASQAQMNAPRAVAIDAAGNLYIADTANNVVREVTPDGNIHAFAGNGTAGFGGDGSAATSAQLNNPQGVAVDSKGNVYISDTSNARVRKVSGGTISTVAGNGTPGYGGDGGSAASAELYTPVGLATDAAGNLYIADFNNHRIRMVTPGGAISTVAGSGSSGYSGDGGLAVSAQLNYPIGVAVDSGGNLYIADHGNYVIRKVLSGSGGIYTIAGTGTAGYSGDGGPALAAQIGGPAGVAVDPQWNVYFTDGSARVRKIYTFGLIVTIAGNGTHGYAGDGGAATLAQLNTPNGLAVDSTGNVFVADTANNAVRLVQPSGSGLAIGAIESSASSQTGLIAPGELISIYGSGLGPGTPVSSQLNSAGLVGTNLAGTIVYVNGVQAPVLYTSPTQVNAIVPFATTGTSAQIVVSYLGQITAPVTVNVSAAAPGVFTMNGSGSGQALAVNVSDGNLNGPTDPAKAGGYVTVYITGAGQTDPPGTDGLPGSIPLPQLNFPVTATIGGAKATVQYDGGAVGVVAGVVQVNLQIPSGVTGQVPLQIAVGGANAQNGVTIWVTQ